MYTYVFMCVCVYICVYIFGYMVLKSPSAATENAADREETVYEVSTDEEREEVTAQNSLMVVLTRKNTKRKKHGKN